LPCRPRTIFVGCDAHEGARCQNVVVILQDIHALLKDPPKPDPRTWLNKKAADLYFNAGQEGREEYKRTVRRFAQRSMEEDGEC
jgi:ubiquitin-protein ligase